MKTEGNLTSGPQILRARPAGEVRADLKPAEEILEQMCEQAPRGPVIIGLNWPQAIGAVVKLERHRKQRLTRPIHVRIVAKRTAQEFQRWRGCVPEYEFIYEVEGLD